MPFHQRRAYASHLLLGHKLEGEPSDIDLAIDVSNFLDKDMSDESIKEWDIEPSFVDVRFVKLRKRARTATDEQLRIKAFLQELSVRINERSENIYIDEKKVGPGTVFGLYPQLNSDGEDLDIPPFLRKKRR